MADKAESCRSETVRGGLPFQPISRLAEGGDEFEVEPVELARSFAESVEPRGGRLLRPVRLCLRYPSRQSGPSAPILAGQGRRCNGFGIGTIEDWRDGGRVSLT